MWKNIEKDTTEIKRNKSDAKKFAEQKPLRYIF
jgi:hypothetical protein